jgi:hypothetical protein
LLLVARHCCGLGGLFKVGKGVVEEVVELK